MLLLYRDLPKNSRAWHRWLSTIPLCRNCYRARCDWTGLRPIWTTISSRAPTRTTSSTSIRPCWMWRAKQQKGCWSICLNNRLQVVSCFIVYTQRILRVICNPFVWRFEVFLPSRLNFYQSNRFTVTWLLYIVQIGRLPLPLFITSQLIRKNIQS